MSNIRVIPQSSGRNWSSQLGTALMILGILALITMATHVPRQEILFGWLVVLSGITESIHAFHRRKSEGFFMHVIPGVTALPIALLAATQLSSRPAAEPLVWMLQFASYFIVIGAFRAVAAFRLRFARWQWAELDGIVTLLLGICLWASWPKLGPSPRPLGVCLGVSLVLRGWSLVISGPRFLKGARREDETLQAA